MSTPFLNRFSQTIVRRLVADGALELSGSEQDVAAYVAEHLSNVKANSSLISSLVRALVACPQVDELFADDDDIKALVEDMGTAWRTTAG